jgi:hypothetical protein
MGIKLDGKTSAGFNRLNTRTRDGFLWRSLDFGVHKIRFRDYQLLKEDSVPWSQPVCYGGWVRYLLRGIMRQSPQVVDSRAIISHCKSVIKQAVARIWPAEVISVARESLRTHLRSAPPREWRTTLFSDYVNVYVRPYLTCNKIPACCMGKHQYVEKYKHDRTQHILL